MLRGRHAPNDTPRLPHARLENPDGLTTNARSRLDVCASCMKSVTGRPLTASPGMTACGGSGVGSMTHVCGSTSSSSVTAAADSSDVQKARSTWTITTSSRDEASGLRLGVETCDDQRRASDALVIVTVNMTTRAHADGIVVVRDTQDGNGGDGNAGAHTDENSNTKLLRQEQQPTPSSISDNRNSTNSAADAVGGGGITHRVMVHREQHLLLETRLEGRRHDDVTLPCGVLHQLHLRDVLQVEQLEEAVDDVDAHAVSIAR